MRVSLKTADRIWRAFNTIIQRTASGDASAEAICIESGFSRASVSTVMETACRASLARRVWNYSPRGFIGRTLYGWEIPTNYRVDLDLFSRPFLVDRA